MTGQVLGRLIAFVLVVVVCAIFAAGSTGEDGYD